MSSSRLAERAHERVIDAGVDLARLKPAMWCFSPAINNAGSERLLPTRCHRPGLRKGLMNESLMLE